MLSEAMLDRIETVAHAAAKGLPRYLWEYLVNQIKIHGRTIAEEATAAERERLMELTCPSCGAPAPKESNKSWEIGSRQSMHWCPKQGGFAITAVAYAEFLRLHPEAGEGG